MGLGRSWKVRGALVEHKKGRSRHLRERPVEIVSAESSLSSWLEESDRFGGHLGVRVVRATRIRGYASRVVGRFYQIVAEKVIFNFLAGHVGEHDTIDLDTG